MKECVTTVPSYGCCGASSLNLLPTFSWQAKVVDTSTAARRGPCSPTNGTTSCETARATRLLGLPQTRCERHEWFDRAPQHSSLSPTASDPTGSNFSATTRVVCSAAAPHALRVNLPQRRGKVLVVQGSKRAHRHSSSPTGISASTNS